jgi:uncharacterized membrane protein YraQ (UPF0718 family)
VSGAAPKGGGTARGKRPVSPALLVFLSLYAIGVVAALVLDIPVGVETARNFVSFAREMVFILPAAFVVIGLFEVWVPREAVERHLGEDGGRFLQWFTMVLLASTTVGGLYVSFPIAYALRSKGARLGLVLSYIGLSGVCRIPMTLFEISFLGVPFTVIRYVVSVPLVILVSEMLGARLRRRGYEMTSPQVGDGRSA